MQGMPRIVQSTPAQPFFQPIFDLCSPRLTFPDAACVADAIQQAVLRAEVDARNASRWRLLVTAQAGAATGSSANARLDAVSRITASGVR